MKRRRFIQQSTLAVSGSLLVPMNIGCNPSREKRTKSIGLQLYTLRDAIVKDMPGTLKKVAEIGYSELETYSYGDWNIFGHPFTDYIKVTQDLGLQTISGHYNTGYNHANSGNLLNGWEQAVADAKEAGQKYMVIASLHSGERQTIDQYKKACELINKGAEVCMSYGITMGYHNHDFEFAAIDNQVPYDVMLAELDPTLVCMELDLYWIVKAGFTPIDYFNRYPGRFELCHVKDMHKTDGTKNADIGTGTINFIEILNYRHQAGLKHFFVEQETYEISPLVSIQNNFTYMNEIL
ncbi:sugar phosphate isomerase/epimerase [Oscillatoria amoena NRMC-F 0135]|nr:sugar phosphate isomerase/epimerase [Oscillatoria amoena NRMC-F 0135]